jgi:DNA-binding SARP family transcriptional activator/tetratricopeptide (TPR) repeat protein
MTAKFGVLGPLQITGPDGRWVRLRGDRQRSLLAVLLFHANERVPVERLVDALWPDVPPKSYASNLHTYVSRLRDRLGTTVIDHAGPGYRLLVADEDLDLLTFRAAGESGRAALRRGDAGTAARHLRLALDQWRGHPLADLTLPVLDAEVARLEIERLTVFEDWADAELAAGRHTELLGELQVAVAENPLRERLVGQLMRALRRAGRQADALTVYRDARATLVEETGLEPGADLRAVHTEILRGDDLTDEWPIRQLPADPRVFTGRDHAVDELTALLTEPGGLPVVLTGEPGVGKSSLAVRVAHRLRPAFPDGQLYAHLAGATAPRPVDDVLTDLLRSLGVTGPGIPDDVHAKAAVLRSRLADRRVLLVLDDAADPGQVRPLLPGTASIAVLVTSRRRLSGLLSAHRVTVGSLTDDEALDLLAAIAGPRVTADPDGAARIAAACGNLPLALRIAGTRLALRPRLRLTTLADRLEDERRRLDELSVSDLQVRAGLALSYAALTGPARATFRLIGAAAVTGMPAWAITVLQNGVAGEDAVDELVESSLLQPAADDACGEPRYEMHDLVLTFARERLLAEDGPDECAQASARLLDAILAVANRLGEALPAVFPALEVAASVHGSPLPECSLPKESLTRYAADPAGWFAIERPSLVAAVGLLVDSGRYARAARIFERLARYLWPQGSYADLRTCAAALAEAGRAAGDERVEVWAEAVHARVLHVRGHYDDAVGRYRWCADRLGADRAALAWVLTNLADCLTGLGVPEEALALTDRAAALSTEDAVASARSAALNRLGRPAESVRVDTGALAAARESADPRAVADALQSLSWSLALTGELDRAAAAAGEAVALLRDTTARRALARSLRTLGAIQAGRGERDRALAAFAECRAIAEEINEVPRVLSSRRAIAASWVGDGRAAEAVTELRACVAAYREMGSASSTVITLRLLAAAHDAAGAAGEAARARAEADLTADPRDSNVHALTTLLMNLTRVPGPSLSAH